MFYFKLSRYILYTLPVFSLVFFYTYCVPAFRPPTQLASEVPKEEELVKEKDDEPIDEDAEIDETVIPYDIRLDTMALLTCDSADIPGENFKFRAGAFLKEIYEGGGGIKLRSPFVNVDKDIIRKYPYYNTFPTLSFGSASGGLYPFHFPLRNIKLKNHLDDLSEGYVHKFRSTLVDFKVPLPEREIPSSQLDEFFREPVLATFITTTPASRRQNILPAIYIDDNGDQEIHGRSYEVRLEEQESFFTIRSISEIYPLLSTEYEWECGNVFKVHRHRDIRYNSEGNDDPTEEACDQDDESNDSLYKLARILLGKEWFIDTQNQCISPKNRRKYCYGSRPERVDFSNDCRGLHRGYHCPHYFSICTSIELQ